MSEQEKEDIQEEISDPNIYKYGIGIALVITFSLLCYAIYMLIYDLINY